MIVPEIHLLFGWFGSFVNASPEQSPSSFQASSTKKSGSNSSSIAFMTDLEEQHLT